MSRKSTWTACLARWGAPSRTRAASGSPEQANTRTVGASDSSEPVYTERTRRSLLDQRAVLRRCRSLGPITAGGPVEALDPPSDDEVMRALEKARPIQGGFDVCTNSNATTCGS